MTGSRIGPRHIAWSLAILVSLATHLLLPAVPAAAKDPPPPVDVTIGIYAIQIPAFSVKDNYVDLDYYLWFRWEGGDEEFKPHKTFELVNGRQTCTTIAEEKKDGYDYVTLRCNARLTKYWDLSAYPFDNQTVDISIEDSQWDETSLIYLPDYRASRLNPELVIPGWSVSGKRERIAGKTYQSNFGDPTIPPDELTKYSRYTFSIDLRRGRYALNAALKIFLPLVVAILIATLQFFVPVDSPLRYNLAAGSIFASVGASYVLSNSLPVSSTLTIAELINLATILTIFLALAGVAASLAIYRRTGDLQSSRRFDRRCGLWILGGYLVACVLIVLL